MIIIFIRINVDEKYDDDDDDVNDDDNGGDNFTPGFSNIAHGE